MKSARGLVVGAVLIAAAAGGWIWWNSPERQVRRMLAEVAESLSYETPQTPLAAAAGAARLQPLLAEEVVVDAGRPFAPLNGRESVLGAAVRVRAAVSAMRVEFVDVEITLADGGAAATVNSTVTATLTDPAGQQTTDAREVIMDLAAVDGRWTIRRIQAVRVVEPIT